MRRANRCDRASEIQPVLSIPAKRCGEIQPGVMEEVGRPQTIGARRWRLDEYDDYYDSRKKSSSVEHEVFWIFCDGYRTVLRVDCRRRQFDQTGMPVRSDS